MIKRLKEKLFSKLNREKSEYPAVPHCYDEIGAWHLFASEAPYQLVEDVYQQYKGSRTSPQHNIEVILLTRLCRDNWPKLSDEFIAAHQEDFFRINSRLDALLTLPSGFNVDKACYLIDANNQILGIIVTPNLVISGICTAGAGAEAVRKMRHKLLTEKEMRSVEQNIDRIIYLLKAIDKPRPNDFCWISRPETTHKICSWRLLHPELRTGTENTATIICKMVSAG